MHRDHPGRDFFLGAMLGSTLGALTAMVFTTKKGREIRKSLLNQYHELEGMVKGYAKKGKRKAKRAVSQLSHKVKKKIKRSPKEKKVADS